MNEIINGRTGGFDVRMPEDADIVIVGNQVTDPRSQLRALTPDGAQVVLSWLATEAGLHPEVAAALERALGCEAETRAK